MYKEIVADTDIHINAIHERQSWGLRGSQPPDFGQGGREGVVDES